MKYFIWQIFFQWEAQCHTVDRMGPRRAEAAAVSHFWPPWSRLTLHCLNSEVFQKETTADFAMPLQ